ncbi:hypothetical protein [Paraburkholderia acidipaludis]|uniref:hypothetical protein n=1 Tax=Paraburkholderia acidipaludis TaxID=660537 RepID=UPI0012ECB600|nr:hypothetical protein [Paraburkholderia acidipaludis]
MNTGIPNGSRHIEALRKLRNVTESATIRKFSEHEPELSLIGTSLSALYDAGTCRRQCHGGGHILESICGRAYNLSAAALDLMVSGYYDEALNLIRSMGELSNLLIMSIFDKAALAAWLSSDTKTRIQKFSPAAIRRILEASPEGKRLMYADKDWYSHFCEAYTHVTPDTVPNHHGEQAIVGGVFQEKGFLMVLEELTHIVTSIGLVICRYFKFDDLLDELRSMIGRS